MAAMLGLDEATAAEVAREAAQGQVCDVANDNGGAQVVVSGHKQAVERAVAIAPSKGAKRAVMLTVSAPFRAPLWSAILLRLVISPALAVLLVMAFGFSRDVSASLILAAAAPTAVNTALLAHEFGGDVSFATSAVYYSTLISLITTPALVYVLKLWLAG